MNWQEFIDWTEKKVIGKPISKVAYYGNLIPPPIKGKAFKIAEMKLNEENGYVGIFIREDISDNERKEFILSFMSKLEGEWRIPIQFYKESSSDFHYRNNRYISFKDGRNSFPQRQFEASFTNGNQRRFSEYASEVYLPYWDKIPTQRWHEPVEVYVSENLPEEERINFQRSIYMTAAMNAVSVKVVPKEHWPEGGRLFSTQAT